MAEDDGDFLYDRTITNEERSRRIAEVLRNGNPSKMFLLGLAMMFAPADPRQKPDFRAYIKGPKHVGRRPEKPMYEAGVMAADLYQRDDWKPEAAVQAAMDKFGISRSEAYKAYKSEIRDRQAMKRFAEMGVEGFDEIVREWW